MGTNQARAMTALIKENAELQKELDRLRVVEEFAQVALRILNGLPGCWMDAVEDDGEVEMYLGAMVD